jgi:hypothetical protein
VEQPTSILVERLAFGLEIESLIPAHDLHLRCEARTTDLPTCECNFSLIISLPSFLVHITLRISSSLPDLA